MPPPRPPPRYCPFSLLCRDPTQSPLLSRWGAARLRPSHLSCVHLSAVAHVPLRQHGTTQSGLCGLRRVVAAASARTRCTITCPAHAIILPMNGTTHGRTWPATAGTMALARIVTLPRCDAALGLIPLLRVSAWWSHAGRALPTSLFRQLHPTSQFVAPSLSHSKCWSQSRVGKPNLTPSPSAATVGLYRAPIWDFPHADHHKTELSRPSN